MHSQTEFEQILRKYGDSIYRIALIHTQNEMDAQDIVQEVFLKYAGRKYFSDTCSPGNGDFTA